MATLSGQKAVAVAGTEEALGSQVVNGPVLIKALPGNTDLVYIGNVNGAVSASTGFPLSAGNTIVLNQVGNLAEIMVDAVVNGEGVAWLVMG